MTTRHRLCSIATFASLGVICSFVNAAPAGAQAVDPLGDFLPTYLGVQGGDLDVLSTGATYDGNNFLFTATLNGVVGTTTGGFYVWGVNRGTGTAGFSSLGLDGVLFD
ncbi:MAG: hypothetical protein H7Z41_20070, partial [Cytophagales bacterium]|nr:hypothetical protein [Armatimonadota bacterium]